MDIKKFAVDPTSRLHLRDANDELMYVCDVEGKPDESKPIAVVLYGPGSRQYAKAQARQHNRMVDKLKSKRKADQNAEQRAEENAEFLGACTVSWENMIYDKLEGDALSKAVYCDASIGFIAEQVGKHLGEWGNFSKVSTKTSGSTSDSSRG